MPTFGDIASFLGGQLFGSTFVPSVDLSGKTIIITGANTGLGFEAAKHLISLKVSTLILACRNTTKAKEAREKLVAISSSTKVNIEVSELDQCSYASVLSFIQRTKAAFPRLDGLIANAGVEMHHYEEAEGVEQTLTVNVISTFMLAAGLLPLLESTASQFALDTHLTIVGSMIHTFAPDAQLDVPVDKDIWEALSDVKLCEGQWQSGRYPLSKLLDHHVFHKFAAVVERRASKDSSVKGGQVIANIVNPGWCGTELARASTPDFFTKFMFAFMGWTSEKGSRTLVHGVTTGRESCGKYLSNCQVKEEASYMRSKRGMRHQERIWKDLTAKYRVVAPEIAEILS